MFEDKPHRRSRERLSKRAWEQAEARAPGHARVPWKGLAEAAHQYTEWHVFTLSLRAVVDAAGTIPEIVETELKSRAPQFLETVRRTAVAALQLPAPPGSRLWQDVSRWAEANVFLSAKRENWLDAVHYFSSLSIRSTKAWAYWERTDELWQRAAPKSFPSYEEWRTDVGSVDRLSNRESICQQVLDSMNRIGAQKFSELEAAFFELTVFSSWMELVMETQGPTSPVLNQELLVKYKGFKSPDGFLEPQANVRALSEWVLNHQLTDAREQWTMAALSYQVRTQSRYHALRRYAQHCHQAWQESPRPSMRLFEEWTEAGDQYVEDG
jgi:hypothetical protein